MSTKQDFFSSVRTEPDLKQATIAILKQLGLSWGAFVNNAARQLVSEKKVSFEIRDSAGFTPAKAQEMKKIMADVKKGKNLSKKMKLPAAKKYLSSLNK